MPRTLPTSRRRELAAAMLLSVPLVLGPAAAAVAAPPNVSVFEVDDTFLSRTSVACGFDILAHVEGTIRVTDFVDADGEAVRTLVTYPRLTYTFINAETGTSVSSRSPDPEHVTWHADGSFTLRVTGLVMHLAEPGGAMTGQAGQFVISIDAEGEEVESEPVGLNEDYHVALCQILAP